MSELPSPVACMHLHTSPLSCVRACCDRSFAQGWARLVGQVMLLFPRELIVMRSGMAMLTNLLAKPLPNEQVTALQLALKDAASQNAVDGPTEDEAEPMDTDDGTCEPCTPAECAICFRNTHETQLTFLAFECGHGFCGDCSRQHIGTRLQGDGSCSCPQCSGAAIPECPLCRNPLGPRSILAAFADKVAAPFRVH